MEMKGVLFDLDWVLLDTPAESDTALHMQGLRFAYGRMAGLGLELPPFQMAFGMAWKRLSEARIGLAFGNLREIDIEKEASALLSKAAPGLGPDGARRAVEDWFSPFAAALSARDGAAAALQRLRGAGLRIGAGINTPWPRRLVETALARTGIAGLFDSLTVSSEIGLRRPNLFFFRAALESMGVPGPLAAYAGGPSGEAFDAAEELLMTTIAVESAPSPGRGPRFAVASVESVPDVVLGTARPARD